MAAPRVFISSTYYDLQHVRNDIRIFLQGLGYEPVMHDKGNIPYTQEVTLEESCYNELDTCDIVVCIIGNKFGTKSSSGDFSITMNELQTAIRNRKKVYIYILKDVYTENFTYLANKSNEFTPYHVDNIKIHEFIADLKANVKNHPILPFENVLDITNNLKQQFAGLFQHLLSQVATITESKTYEDLQNSAQEIRELIREMSEEKQSFFHKFDSTIYAVTPAIRYLLKLLGDKKYEIFASNRDSLIQFLTDVGYYVSEDLLPFEDITATYISEDYKHVLTIKKQIFDDTGNVIYINNKAKLEQYITIHTEILDTPDSLPF